MSTFDDEFESSAPTDEEMVKMFEFFEELEREQKLLSEECMKCHVPLRACVCIQDAEGDTEVA